LRFLAAGVSILCVSVASAGVIVSDFGPGESYSASGGLGIHGAIVLPQGTVPAVSYAAAFTPTSTVEFGSVVIAALGLDIGSAPDLVVSLDADSNGTPGSVLESFSFPPSDFSGSVSEVSEVLTGTSVLNPTLVAGTQYWIQVSSADLNAIYEWDNNSLSPGQYGVEQYMNGSWSFLSDVLTPAFEVDSLDPTPAPEPAAGVLLGIGLLALVLTRTRPAARKA